VSGRRLLAAAALAVAVAVVALIMRPFLHPSGDGHRRRPSASPVVMAIPVATDTAIRGAVAALSCARYPASHRWCGPYTVTRQQTTCTSSTQCTVELIGSLRSASGEVPVALTVAVANAGGRWRVRAVSS
jgi:hypothetical protein